MNKYLLAVMASFMAAALVLTAYFTFTRMTEDAAMTEAEPDGPVVNAFESTPLEASAQGALDDAADDSAPSEISPALSDVPQVVKLNGAWIEGWWAEDGPCIGDGGERFVANGEWYIWANSGDWIIEGKRLTIRETVHEVDTVSGEPEPIDPPIVHTGTIANAEQNSFEFRTASGVRHMVRCE
ncbi:MAG: hypothetical protein WAT93_14900 [Pontixanthobacter sp.]